MSAGSRRSLRRPTTATESARLRDPRGGRLPRLRPGPGPGQGLAARPPRRDLRPARTQRLRQIDAHPHPLRPARPDGRARLGGRPGRRDGRGGGPPAHRVRAAEVLALRRPDGAREPQLLRLRVRPEGRRAERAPRVGDRADRDRPVSRAPRRPALRRVEAAPRPRRLAHAPPPRPLPGRADRRDRPGRPARALEPPLHARRRRRHAPRQHALHGRGGALRPRGVSLPVPHARRGGPGRARRSCRRSRRRGPGASRPTASKAPRPS